MFKNIKDTIINCKKISLVVMFGVILMLVTILTAIQIKNKQQYHFDEVYTFKTIALFPFPLMERYQDKWLNNNNINQDIFVINKNQKHQYGKVAEVTKFDVHPPLYYWLMHLMGSLFSSYVSTKVLAGILNLLFFYIGAPFFYLIIKQISKNSLISLAALFCYGISIATISNLVWARMYSLAVMSVLIFTYATLKLKNKFKFNSLIIFVASFIIGALSHYYFLVYGAVLISFVLLSIVFENGLKNNWRIKLTKFAKIFFSVIFSWLVSLLIFPHAINHLTQSKRSNQITDKLKLSINERFNLFIEKIVIFSEKFDSYVFYQVKILLLIVFILIVYYFFKGRKSIEIKYNRIVILLLTFISFSFFILYISPYNDLRYLSFTIPIFFILFFSSLSLLKNKKMQYLLIIIICFTFTFYSINKDPLYIPKCYKMQERISEQPMDVMILDKNEIMGLMYYYYLPKNINIYYSTRENNNFNSLENPDKLYLIVNMGKDNEAILKSFKEKYKVEKIKERFCSIKQIYYLEKK